MIPRKRVLSALFGGRVDRVPTISANQSATLEQMQQLGVFWPEAHYEAEKMARLASGASTLLGFDLVRVPFCQTVEAEALGCELRTGGKDAIPSVQAHPFKAGQTVKLPPQFNNRGRIPAVAKAVRMLKSELGDQVAVMGGVVGPFSLAGHMIGTDNLLIESAINPKHLEPLLAVAVDAAAVFAAEMITQGADIICIEDMTASGDMIGPNTYRDLVLPFQKKLLEQIGQPTVLHICGNVDAVIELMAESGADALSIEEKTNLAVAKRKVGDRVALIGTIDPSKTLLLGKRADVLRKSREALANGIDLLAPGCAVAPETPTANLQAMVEATQKFGQPERKAKVELEEAFTQADAFEVGRELARIVLKTERG